MTLHYDMTLLSCLREYNLVIRKVKISDPDSSERHSAARLLRHPRQYMVHASVEECWGKDTSLTYTSFNWKVVRDGAITQGQGKHEIKERKRELLTFESFLIKLSRLGLSFVWKLRNRILVPGIISLRNCGHWISEINLIRGCFSEPLS